jgi:hypothetical protein
MGADVGSHGVGAKMGDGKYNDLGDGIFARWKIIAHGWKWWGKTKNLMFFW